MRTPALSRALGKVLQKIREQHGARQDDLARAARASGLPWTASSVAALETGRRALTVDEMEKLPRILHELGVPSARSEWNSPAPPFRWLGDADGGMLTLCGEPLTLDSGRRWEKSLQQIAAGERVVKAVPDVTKEEMAAARLDEDGVLEGRIARRFKVDPLAVAVVARRRWGRSVTEERDRRSADATADASRRAAQTLRGHVTRALIEELRQGGIERLKAKKAGRSARPRG